MEQDPLALRCLVCGRQAEQIDRPALQPYGATAFTTHGHYGSTAFDPADDAQLHVVVCDTCLVAATDAGRVHFIAADAEPIAWEVDEATRQWVHDHAPGEHQGRRSKRAAGREQSLVDALTLDGVDVDLPTEGMDIPPVDFGAEPAAATRSGEFAEEVRNGYPVEVAARLAGITVDEAKRLIDTRQWPALTREDDTRVVPRAMFGPDGAELSEIRRVSRAAAESNWSVFALVSFLHRRQPYWGSHQTAHGWLAAGRDPEWVLDCIGPSV